jgi:hypothetical protein
LVHIQQRMAPWPAALVSRAQLTLIPLILLRQATCLAIAISALRAKVSLALNALDFWQ